MDQMKTRTYFWYHLFCDLGSLASLNNYNNSDETTAFPEKLCFVSWDLKSFYSSKNTTWYKVLKCKQTMYRWGR